MGLDYLGAILLLNLCLLYQYIPSCSRLLSRSAFQSQICSVRVLFSLRI